MLHRTFYKLQGAGNDFIFFDDLSSTFPIDKKRIAELCDRHKGIGADGLVLMRPAAKADCRMVYFNSDGGEASFCGNALRCTALALRASGQNKTVFTVETSKGIMRCMIRGDRIETTFPAPALIAHSLPIFEKSFHVIDAGVPHAVAVVDDLDLLDVHQLGRKVRYSPQVGPQGANVTFMQRAGDGCFHIRTYERGVEGETLSCGTGAVAAAYVAKLPRVHIKTKGGDDFEVNTESWLLIGPATLVFVGEI